MNILCGDIGGTKTLLQLLHTDGHGNARELYRHRYASGDFCDFNSVIADFIDNYGDVKIASACFGVAGPVSLEHGSYHSSITNLPWQINSENISEKFSIPSVVLLNDFESTAIGLDRLGENDFITLQSGTAFPGAMQLVIGAGTGLGVAYRTLWNNRIKVFSTEAGHGDFAPGNEEQLRLAQYLMRHQGHCSIESVLSGPGLVNVYTFVCEQALRPNSRYRHQHMQTTDPAASIANAADSGIDEDAVAAMNLFVECYGSQAGNLALSCLARGGVYIAGGIAPKIVDWLKKDLFMSAFANKSKMSTLLLDIPVKVVMNPEAGLLGSQIIATDFMISG